MLRIPALRLSRRGRVIGLAATGVAAMVAAFAGVPVMVEWA